MNKNRALSRGALLLAASAASMVSAQTAFAQDKTAASSDDSDKPVIVVTGTRVEGRTRLDTSSPVDVISAQSLQDQGTTELATALATVTPSIDFPRPAVTDGTDAIRPATLRGLSPDQTLVLINGVRAHPSALLNINGSVGRGSAAVDLNTIPSSALETIEVLRDGASAQYGSDAIAGVVNLRLREASSGGAANVTYGFYDTQVNTARDSRHVSGESTTTLSGWQGASLGGDGFLTLSGEYTHRNPTSRGDLDPRLTVPKVDSRYGDPEVDSYTAYFNAGKPIGGTWELYGFGGYQYRNSKSAAFPRTPTTVASNGLSSVYPDGFLPLIQSKSRDFTLTGGARGEVSGWNVDLNLSYGENELKFYTINSANFDLGVNTQFDFYDGSLKYTQLVGGLDVSKEFDVFQSLNVAWGIEARREGYKIGAGEPNSYFGGGAQGFPGFSSLNEISRHRSNGSIYLDLEAQLTDKFRLGLAGRGEDYSDFGTTGTGKVSARYDITPNFALRGTASTGFRAPSLQQEYFTSIASVVDTTTNDFIKAGTFPSTDPVAAKLGGLPLQPEKSTNLSAGFVIRTGNFNMTVDAYRIHIRDQLGLSENIRADYSSAVGALLTPLNVSAARFFINGLASTTKGVDIVGNYRLDTATAGTFDLTLAANFNDIKVTKVPTTTSTLDPAPTLFSRSRIVTMEEGTPRQKVTGSVVWKMGSLGATARATYYGDVNQPSSVEANDLHTGKHIITDFELRYGQKRGFNAAIGVNNLFDVYPDMVPAARNGSGVLAFPFYSPFGFNGRYLYARAGFRW